MRTPTPCRPQIGCGRECRTACPPQAGRRSCARGRRQEPSVGTGRPSLRRPRPEEGRCPLFPGREPPGAVLADPKSGGLGPGFDFVSTPLLILNLRVPGHSGKKALAHQPATLWASLAEANRISRAWRSSTAGGAGAELLGLPPPNRPPQARKAPRKPSSPCRRPVERWHAQPCTQPANPKRPRRAADAWSGHARVQPARKKFFYHRDWSGPARPPQARKAPQACDLRRLERWHLSAPSPRTQNVRAGRRRPTPSEKESPGQGRPWAPGPGRGWPCHARLPRRRPPPRDQAPRSRWRAACRPA